MVSSLEVQEDPWCGLFQLSRDGSGSIEIWDRQGAEAIWTPDLEYDEDM